MNKLFIAGFALAGMIGAQVLLAPKGEPAVYKGPHKPHTKLKEVVQKHSGKAEWRELVVDDERLRSEYVQLKPGFKSLKMMHPDTRTWWVVVSGEMKFTIETVEPFIAKKGAIVQCPFQTWFQFETVGDKPAIVFETNIAGALTLYETGATPPKFPALDWRPAAFNNRVIAKWEKANKPVITFDEVAADIESGKRKGTQRMVEDARGTANFIYGYNSKLPPLDPNNKGHYHPEGAEYWLIMKGLIRYPIEKIGVVIAEEGDVVYIPKFTWHAPRWWGDGPACRLAMNGFPDIAHLFEAH